MTVYLCRCNSQSWHPDLDWLEETLKGKEPPRMVVLVNPCNPTGNFTSSSRSFCLTLQSCAIALLSMSCIMMGRPTPVCIHECDLIQKLFTCNDGAATTEFVV